MTAGPKGPHEADFLDNRFSPALKVAQAQWLADADAERAEQYLSRANTASKRSTKFVLRPVLLMVVGLSLLVVSLVRMALLDNTW